MNITDIARLSGVSKATVSRVLSDSPDVKESTRLKVLKIIKENHYEPNNLARNLSQKKTCSIGVIVEEISNPFFITIASEIEKILYTRDYTMSLSNSQWNKEKELKIVKAMLRTSVDGFIIAPTDIDSEAVALLKKSFRPMILMNAYIEDPAIGCVGTDNRQGGILAAEHFLKNRRSQKEELIIISGYRHQNLTERLEGFHSHLASHGFDSAQVSSYEDINTYDDGWNLSTTLITRNQLETTPACLFVTNDYVAMGVQDGLHRMNISIPDTVRMIGYDNIEFSGRCRIPLTTIEQSQRDIGRIAALELLEVINNPGREIKKYKLTPRLIIRESSPEMIPL